MSSVRFGEFEFDRANGLLYSGGRLIPLAPRVLGILQYLLDSPGDIVPKRELLAAVWKDAYVTETSLTEAMSLLRQALGDAAQHPHFVQTVHRRGYRFIAEVTKVEPVPTLPVLAPPVTTVTEVGPVEDVKALVVPANLVSESSPRERRRHGLKSWLLIAAALGFIAVLIATGGLQVSWSVLQNSQEPVTRFSIPLGGSTLVNIDRPSIAISPDGRHIVYATPEPDSRLLLRSLDQLEPEVLPGTAGATDPFFSPDGRWIGFFARNSLMRIRLDGSSPTRICEAPHASGGTWYRSDRIVFGLPAGLFEASAFGGELPRPITHTEGNAHEIGHAWPHALPGGNALLFTVRTTTDSRSHLKMLDFDTGEVTVIVTDGAFGRYAPTGHIIYTAAGHVWGVPFERERRVVSGPPMRVLDEVAVTTGGGAELAFSDNGVLVYLPAKAVHQNLNVVLAWFSEIRQLAASVSRISLLT